jgi:membrane fusion protein, multidrug efflux system
MKGLHTSVVIVALAGAGALAWWLQNKPKAGADIAAVDSARPASGAAGSDGASARPGAAAGGAPAVEVGKAELARIEDDAQAVGSLRAHQGVMLRPEVSGRVALLAFRDGQRVRKGQLLVQLDDSLQDAQVKQAEAQATIARTNLQRNRELLAQNFVSQSVVDQSQANLQVAEAQVALAQAQLARMKIIAPFDGVAGIRVAHVGDYLKDGADIVMLEDLSSLWVDFRLPERYLSRLVAGQAVEVNLDAMPNRRFAAKVEALDAQLDANGRSVLVRARMVNDRGELRGGMFARGRFVFDVRDNAIVVPEEALVPLGDKQFVFKVVDGPDGAKLAQRQEARIGQRLPGKVEVREGLKAGDLVVIAGQARLLRGDSQAVRIVDLARAGAAARSQRPGAASAPAGAAPAASGAGSVPRNGAGAV